jgi:hypothetical protein
LAFDTLATQVRQRQRRQTDASLRKQSRIRCILCVYLQWLVGFNPSDWPTEVEQSVPTANRGAQPRRPSGIRLSSILESTTALTMLRKFAASEQLSHPLQFWWVLTFSIKTIGEKSACTQQKLTFCHFPFPLVCLGWKPRAIGPCHVPTCSSIEPVPSPRGTLSLEAYVLCLSLTRCKSGSWCAVTRSWSARDCSSRLKYR